MPEEDDDPKEGSPDSGPASPPSAPPDAGPAPGAPPGAAPPGQARPAGGPTLPPSAAPTSLPVRAAGAQAVMRNQLRLMVNVLMKFSPNFEFDSPEGKAIRGAVNSLGPVFAKREGSSGERTGAMAALMARAGQGAANRIPPGAGGPPPGAPPGPPGGGPPALPRGPVPAPGGAM